MKILGIETSCDETAAAVVENGYKVLANFVSSSLPLHASSGGIIPEIAAREQVKAIIPVIERTLSEDVPIGIGFKKGVSSNLGVPAPNVDAIAVTYGPGLIGSLLVGVEVAKTLSLVWGKPLIPINHLVGHIYAASLNIKGLLSFPLVALIVSGGHTEILFFEYHGEYKYLGGTRDDAAGEAFDKFARYIGLGYPGGPVIEQAAKDGRPNIYKLPRPLLKQNNYDFSFSGLKTAAINLVSKINKNLHLSSQEKADLSYEFQEAVTDVLVSKTILAAKTFSCNNIVIGGGVAANTALKIKMGSLFKGKVLYPKSKYSLDNAAMIAAAAYYNYKPVPWGKVKTNPSLLF